MPSPYLNGLGHDSSSLSTVPDDSDLITLNKRYEQFVQFDQEKTKFMGELIVRYEYLSQQYQIIVSERQRERDWLLQWKNEKQQYENYVKSMQCALSDNPFVMVLIDGDGMIFLEEFLRDGEQGGRRAAHQLHATIQDYIENEANHIPRGSRIVCRIYANVRGLGDVLARTGTLQAAGQFEDFMRGFTSGKAAFDFIDVGAGKDRADKKLIELFKLFAEDTHCRQLLFGCSHDNGYARALEEFSDRNDMLQKVVLVEGVPFEKELIPLPYNTKKFPNLFRDTKLVVWGAGAGAAFLPPQLSTPIDTPNGQKNYSMLSGLPTRFPAPTRPSNEASLMDSPLPSKALLMTLPRTPSSSTIASDNYPVVKPAVAAQNSWASKAAAPPPPVTKSSPVYRPANRGEVIARNRTGQRVDPPCKDYNKAEVDRVKKLKLCNIHYLRRECPYDNNSNCAHDHHYRASDDEISTLRLVAHMAPCLNGSGCQDVRCIYGHRCPAPPHRAHHVKGTKSCIFGEACKFPPELHDIDTNVVKTLVVR